jgi:hypothetical protein
MTKLIVTFPNFANAPKNRCVCMYVYIYICVCVYIHVCTYVQLRSHHLGGQKENNDRSF